MSTSESADITGISATCTCCLAEMLRVKSKIRTSSGIAEVTWPVGKFILMNVKMWHLVFHLALGRTKKGVGFFCDKVAFFFI